MPNNLGTWPTEGGRYGLHLWNIEPHNSDWGGYQNHSEIRAGSFFWGIFIYSICFLWNKVRSPGGDVPCLQSGFQKIFLKKSRNFQWFPKLKNHDGCKPKLLSSFENHCKQISLHEYYLNYKWWLCFWFTPQ